MNDKILEQHMIDDAAFQRDMNEWKGTVATKADIKQIIVEGIEEYFKNKGKFTFSLIIGSSVLIGALIVILGGVKTLLAWIGFTYIK